MSCGNPCISIIVPIYNVKDYLEACLDSIACQTFCNFEVIGVDDCSDDGSSQIYTKYLADERFKLFINYENQGLPSVRNIGIANSSGDYLYFLDSDDWIPPNSLETLFDIAQADKVEMVIGGIMKYYDANGKLELPENHGRVMKCSSRGVDIYSRPELFYSVISCNKLIKSSYVKSSGLIFKTTPRRYEDMLTYKWYLSGARISIIDDVTYFYRQRDVSSNINASIMQDKSLSAFTDKILAYDDILRFVKNRNLLFTNLDPMHSPTAMMNLPRALDWIYRDVFVNYRNNHEELATFVLVNKKLLGLFDDIYLSKLPKRLRNAAQSIISNRADKAVEKCLVIYG